MRHLTREQRAERWRRIDWTHCTEVGLMPPDATGVTEAGALVHKPKPRGDGNVRLRDAETGQQVTLTATARVILLGWAVGPGRTLLLDGNVVCRLDGDDRDPREVRPVVLDSAAHLIAELLNRSGATLENLYERHMGKAPLSSTVDR